MSPFPPHRDSSPNGILGGGAIGLAGCTGAEDAPNFRRGAHFDTVPMPTRSKDNLFGGFDCLEKDLSSLYETLQTLIARMEPLCVPSPPRPVEGNAVRPEPPASAAQHRIAGLSAAVRLMTANVQDTLSRLEV